MLQRIQGLFRARGGAAAPDSTDFDDTQCAVAALFVEAAHMDTSFDEAERATMRDLLAQRFALDTARADALVARGEEIIADANEVYRFTRTIKDSFDHEERVELMQMLWEVVYADGELHSFEANLMRRMAGLVHVSDRENGEARKRALARLGLPQG
mgnify:CR=1 FL=1